MESSEFTPNTNTVYKALDIANLRIETNGLLKVEPNRIKYLQHEKGYYSSNANPCLIGYIELLSNNIIFHSSGSFLQGNILELLRNAEAGIIGGGKETLKLYKKYFMLNSRINVITGREGEMFSLLTKPGNTMNRKREVQYCYSSLDL